MTISAKVVKELRELTGVGMMDCKQALVETDGDMDKAVEVLRKKGLADAQKKSGRIASEGAVGSYIHMGGRIGVLIEINCETDFVARTEKFQELVRNLAMHVAASNPDYVRPEDVPAEKLESEKSIYREQSLAEGKPEKVADKIVEGRIKKYYEQVCLLEQQYIRSDDKKTVRDLINEAISEIGENIQIRRFTRYVLGEGLEKRQDDLAAEVAKAIQS
jgi:elongation factor Ts